MKYLCLVMAAVASVAVAACTSSGSRGAPINSTATGPGAMRVAGGTSIGERIAPQTAGPEVAALEASECVIYFDLDSAAIRAGQRKRIDKCAKFFVSHPKASLQLEGYADERGTDEYNLKLGERRAKAVMAHLTARGVPDDRIAVASFGETRPAAEGHDEWAWRRNRRVEFASEAQSER